MQSDYEILGLATEASADDIKRAYFKLVRKFSPEKDPENFQKIRGAYERLIQTGNMEDAIARLELEIPASPDAKNIFNKIETLISQKEYKKAAAEAEQAISGFGECEAFLYLLAYSQQLNGNRGKAIKNYVKLVKQYPDKNIYKRGLALTYFERGFNNKAMLAFEDAYKSGTRDIDFILQFSLCCHEQGHYHRGIKILIELVSNFDSTSKEQIGGYIEAFVGIFTMNFFIVQDYFDDAIRQYARFLKIAGRLIKKYDEAALELAFAIVMLMPDTDNLSCINEILEETEKNFPKDKYHEEWTAISSKLIDSRMEADTRLGDEVKWCLAAFILAYDLYDDTYIRFLQTDCKLIIIERLPEIKKEFDIVKNEYPELYEKMESFFKQLEREDVSYVKEKLLKDYDRIEKSTGEGQYYKLYPENRPKPEKLQWNSFEEGSFVRNEKKIGRNDPCPCGSGKKYKHCCGRNVK